MTKLLGAMLGGTVVSVEIFFLTLLFALPLALPVALGRMSRSRLVRAPVNLYVLVMRGTPLILQILFVYFAPYYLFEASY
ncbi:MAG TPA: ABC transporter permease subunit, partial [Anaeromyxobacteraceae bacterium]|nr:ABC transporter permease subunit [Anaeromyxobacteraceae bacterium]